MESNGVQLGHFGNVRLDEHDRFLRTDARCQPIQRHLVRVLLEVLRILDRRERVQVDDAVDTLVVVLQRHVVLDRAQIIAEMLASRRASTGENTSLLWHHLSFNDFAHQAHHLAWLGMTLGLKLRVDQLAVYGDLEAALVGWDERNGLDQVLEMLEQFSCQAHGPVSVVSDRTVYDLNLEHNPSK